MSIAIILLLIAFVAWFVRHDNALRDGISAALWIPTLWVGILASRPLSTWIGFGGADNSMEGSPADRMFFLVLIVASIIVLSRRGFVLGEFVARNWPLLLFYGYLLFSVLWAESAVVSFKRWFKDFGNVLVALVILTEANPQQALRAVFVRCAYVLIPLSIIFIRYFPDLGRRYSRHSGQMEATGVTFQKNSLGAMVLICGLVLLWDWLERMRENNARMGRFERYGPLAVLAMGMWLFHVSDSKTSIVCFALGACILLCSRFHALRKRVTTLGMWGLLAGLALVGLDSATGISRWIVTSLGRDMTFTGRTDVWRELLSLNTDPIIGTGYCSFWSNRAYLSQLPDWVSSSAHNGYLEVYIDGGWIGVGFLTLVLLVSGARLHRLLAGGGNHALLLFAILVIAVTANFSESYFGRMSPVWFTFLLAITNARQASPTPVYQPFSSVPVTP